jgi:hypothetical protein
MSEETVPSKSEALHNEAVINSSEYDADFDGVISYSEQATMVHPEDDAIVIDDDVVLGEDGFEEVPVYETEEDFEEVPPYTGDEEVEPAVDGVPDGVEEAEAEVAPPAEQDEDEGFLEKIVDESALPEHVKEALNMDVGDAFRELFHHDKK